MNLATAVNGLDVALLAAIVGIGLFIAYALRRAKGEHVDIYRSPEQQAAIREQADEARQENWSWPPRDYKRGV